MNQKALSLAAALTVVLAGCDKSEEVKGFAGFERQVKGNRIGHDADQWIEMKALTGEWERTGLIFGYYNGDYDECLNAIAGLKQVNSEREYRCVPAN